ncbi:hypothetical protein EW146_g6160 [Bondarzewia mesenterica]|uniref:Uncharacterized protein n=1 Tax=Bondarzewia mesenterica TaxID=1095465 RepID=A0A4S4LRH2_9AGAM|nr:hypothetical protein EW146_g6160 [Bondarzewia mesenterica]
MAPPHADARASSAKASTNRAEDESRAFKKSHHVVDHPSITDHNINDEFFKDPPHNVDLNQGQNPKAVGINREEQGTGSPTGILGYQDVGRQKIEEVQSRLLDNESRTLDG